MAPGFGSTRRDGLEPFVDRFVAEGFAVMLFDYRYFGESDGEPRQLADFRKQRADWKAALDHLRRLTEIDAQRIGLWGNSYSGGHVIELAASDPGIKAVVGAAPFSDGRTTMFTRGFKFANRVAIAGIRDLIKSSLGRDPYYMPIFGHPGELASITNDNAVEGYGAIIGQDSKFENRTAARGTFLTPYFRPTTSAKRVQAPLLVQVADDDQTASPRAAEKMALKAPRGQVSHYPGGHFAVFNEPVLTQIIEEQVAFFKRHVA